MLLADGGVPGTVEKRLEIGANVLAHARAAGLPDDRVFVDPLTLAAEAGADMAIMDPLDDTLRSELLAAELVPGRGSLLPRLHESI